MNDYMKRKDSETIAKYHDRIKKDNLKIARCSKAKVLEGFHPCEHDSLRNREERRHPAQRTIATLKLKKTFDKMD